MVGHVCGRRMFKAMVLEGLEIVFIVIAVGATGNMLIPASIGAAIAGVPVMLVGPRSNGRSPGSRRIR